MISQSAEYGLRAVAHVAAHDGKPQTIRQIALATRVPAGYLAKILAALARAGILNAQRGLNGGFILARSAADISLLDIVRVIDPSHRITACPLGIEAHREKLCPLHTQLDDAAARMEDTLAKASIADVLEDCAAPLNPSCPGTCGGNHGHCHKIHERTVTPC